MNKYFKSITRRAVVKEMVPTGEQDSRGRDICESRPVINSLGKEVEFTEYVLPPSVAELCEALGIHRSTWANYCNRQLHPEFADITGEVRERIKAWNERELLTRPGKDLRGIIFNLQANYGYGGEKREMELGPDARKAVGGGMSMREKYTLLKALAEEWDDEPPAEGYDDEREDAD